MHIMEGYLDPLWCVVWFVVAIPFIVLGAKKVIDIIREHPDQKMTVALSGAFIFLLSSLKLPSVTGSSSHPTGTGFAVAVYGVAVTSFLATIVLIFQALLLAHGGITTLGANVVSMGIIGPFIGLLVWKVLPASLPLSVRLGLTALVADLMTYVVTSFQMAINHGGMDAIGAFLSNYAATQAPLAICEFILFFMFGTYLQKNRPDIFAQEA